MNKILLLFFILFGVSVYASNIRIVGDATISNKDISAGANNEANYAYINLSIAWDNTWRTTSAPYNYDAAWVFAKYRISGGEWKHVSISKDDNISEVNTTIEGTDDRRGIFIYSAENFTGNFTANNVKLKWNYVSDGVNDDDDIEVKIFAIEMVYVPQGDFYLGSKGNEWGGFYGDGNSQTPYHVTSENSINISDGDLYYNSNTRTWADAHSGDQQGTITADFPKGYDALYVMKYEMTQEQYVGFLNHLTRSQQNNHTSIDISGTRPQYSRPFVMSKTNSPIFRNGIRCANTLPASEPIEFYCDLNNNNIPNEYNDGQTIACNFISWADAAAYMEWTGLRPITEMEFEKAVRGRGIDNAWVQAWGTEWSEHAWGIKNAGTINELPTNSTANTNFSTDIHTGYDGAFQVGGPMRVGAFATSTTNREHSGSGYYGIMNATDNLRERIITVGAPEGRTFTGTHGSGNLSVDGYHSAAYWPGMYAKGIGLKGADWVAGIHFTSRTADRFLAAHNNYTRNGNIGLRAGRSSQ